MFVRTNRIQRLKMGQACYKNRLYIIELYNIILYLQLRIYYVFIVQYMYMAKGIRFLLGDPDT